MEELKLTKKRKEALESLNINSTYDLLHYYPYRYEIVEKTDYKDFVVNQKITMEAKVSSLVKVNYYNRKGNVATFEVTNQFDTFKVSIFNRAWLKNNLHIGDTITIFGIYQGFNKITATSINNRPLDEQIGIKPIYSLKDKITETTFIKLINEALTLNQDIKDFIPDYLKLKNDLVSKITALNNIHQPKDSLSLQKAIDTLKYEEFFKFQLTMLNRKNQNRITNDLYIKKFDINLINDFINKLPFQLTSDQITAVNEILKDMSSNYSMVRLLQGDVGSGKTIVAFISMYAAFLANKQAVLMAPTEILASQHFENIKRIFKDYPIKIAYLSNKLSNSEKKEILEKCINNEVDFVIGTHSLFQDNVSFSNLGLVITDEQHRFGVKQRNALISKGNYVDVLSMSATPIPRTLANTLYADMDVSSINQVPNKDKIIYTKLSKINSFMPYIDEINALLDDGNQMYVICPSIENNNEDSTIRNVNQIYENLKIYYQGKHTIGLLHGKLDNDQKEIIENEFKNKEIDILVSTTVVEVGVDNKNANIMVIYDANRFGLATLHQLRGRVGRGDKPGYCYLLTSSKDIEAINRLNMIVNTTDGFKISEYDLKLRGPGDLLGFKQSGLPTFTLGNIIEDIDMLKKIKDDVLEIYQHKEQYPEILNYLSITNNTILD